MYSSCIFLIPSIPDMITVEFALKKHLSKDKGMQQGAERSSSLTGLQTELEPKAFIMPELCCKSKEQHLPP